MLRKSIWIWNHSKAPFVLWIGLSLGLHVAAVQLGSLTTQKLRQAKGNTPSWIQFKTPSAAPDGTPYLPKTVDSPTSEAPQEVTDIRATETPQNRTAPATTSNSVLTSGPAEPDTTPNTTLGTTLLQIQASIRKELHYPLHLQRQGIEGRVVLQILYHPDSSTWSNPEIATPSAHPALNELALAAGRAAAATVSHPAQNKNEAEATSSVLIPIDFTLQ